MTGNPEGESDVWIWDGNEDDRFAGVGFGIRWLGDDCGGGGCAGDMTFNGAAIRSIGGEVTVRRSVFNNASTASSMGGYFSGGGSLTVGESIFALNTAVDVREYTNIRAMDLGAAASSS